MNLTCYTAATVVLMNSNESTNDGAVEFWGTLVEKIEEYKNHPECPLEAKKRSWLRAHLRALAQRFFKQLLVSIKVPPAVREAKALVAKDCNVPSVTKKKATN